MEPELDATAPLEHLEWATKLPPLSANVPTPLDPEKQDLLRRLATDPNTLRQQVVEKLKFWTARKQFLQQANQRYQSTLPQEELGTLGQLDLFLMEEMVISSGHIDKDYVYRLSKGFPITGELFDGNVGEPIVGGQRVHNTPGLGGPEPIGELEARCKEINVATIAQARRKVPTTTDDRLLAEAAWGKMKKDMAKGYAGTPIPVQELDLEKNLLVDTFGIHEKHSGCDWKVRFINDFRKNTVNQFAWLPSKLRYDGFGQLSHAASILKETWTEGLTLGTIPTKWLS